ncbi:hypothetical protein CAL28_25830 [Bordetella genomosp. 11]|uniref:Calcium-mediated lectin domain-containing protein n=2 Tax=Bordetella genomosp. 11 TaxID=1416808 RepID=A0A261ULN9_9BORD|nr:hypothetical protein CAL28_25830 [Bordetella genomosp. 11]
MAITTATPLAFWKLESADGKKGGVSVGDAVRIVSAGPNPPYKSALALKCGAAVNTQASGANLSSKEDDTIWYVAMCSVPGSTVPEESYIVLCNKVGWEGVGAVTGNFLNVWYPTGMVPPGTTYDGVNVIMKVYTRYPLDTAQGGNTWWQVIKAAAPSHSPSPAPSHSPSPAPSHSPSPSPALTTGKKCCFDIPAHTDFTVAFTNEEKWTRTVTVYIDGKASNIPVPVGHSTGSKGFVSGAGTAAHKGKSTVCIEVEDSQSGQMLLGWQPPVTAGDSKSVHIGAEKDYPSGGNGAPETRFNDVVVTVSWVVSQPAGSAG